MLKIFFIITIFITGFSSQSFSKQTNNATKIAQFQKPDEDEEFAEFEKIDNENKIEIYDPMEKFNRKIFAFNDAFDRYFFEHLAKAYRKTLPKVIRSSVRNFLTNLSLPISTINSLAQGKTDNAMATFSNFLINSTIGIVGIFDVAGHKNIKYNFEDFGQTLGHYNNGSGAYLMIPFLGPSSSRDFGGWIVTKSIDPLSFNVLHIGEDEKLMQNKYLFGLAGASAIDTRESLLDTIDDVRKDSFDPYATIRSAYLQRRLSEIKN